MTDAVAVGCLVPNTLITSSALNLTGADENSVILPHEIEVLDERQERGLHTLNFDIMRAKQVYDCLKCSCGGRPLKLPGMTLVQILA
jgi:hypothetical protein